MLNRICRIKGRTIDKTIFFLSRKRFTSRIIKKRERNDYPSIPRKNERFVARCSETLEREASEAGENVPPLEKLRSANLKFEIPVPARLLASRQVPSYFMRLTKNSRIRPRESCFEATIKISPRHNRVCGVWVGRWVERVYESRARGEPGYTPLK